MAQARDPAAKPRPVPPELVEALRSVPGAVEAWIRTPVRLRRIYVRHVAEAWSQQARYHRAKKTALWAARGELALLVHRVDWRDPARLMGDAPNAAVPERDVAAATSALSGLSRLS